MLLVQLFRRTRKRNSDQEKLAAVYQKISQMKGSTVSRTASSTKNKHHPWTLPWWCIFVAYGLTLIMVAVSILFIIARGIEFGDFKTQKWLAALFIGFFSSVLITQPLKVGVISSVQNLQANEYQYRFMLF
jgi:hypothetical protein